MRIRPSAVVMTLYLLFLLIPIYWLINMSLKTNTEITGTFTLYPADLTIQNYVVILTDPSWYMGYVNSMIYVTLNVVISITVALPAAGVLTLVCHDATVDAWKQRDDFLCVRRMECA